MKIVFYTLQTVRDWRINQFLWHLTLPSFWRSLEEGGAGILVRWWRGADKFENHCSISEIILTRCLWTLTEYFKDIAPCNKLSTPWIRERRYWLYMQMEKFTPKYSLKNIPFPKKHDFVLSLTDKIVNFIKIMRWKAHFHLNPAVPKGEQRLGVRRLKSQRTPPSDSVLDQFENDLFSLIQKVEFKNSKYTF